MDELIIVQFNGENRIDSRLVAQSLGIAHINFRETLDAYRTELEELGVSRFQTEKPIGGGRPEKYYLLNEDQAIFASTLSRNTRQVVAFKLALTKAFAQARKSGQRVLTEQEIFNQSFHQRCIRNAGKVPTGYFLIAIEMGKEAWSERAYHVELQYNRLPDGSAGIKWPNHLRKIGWDVDRRIQVWGEHQNGVGNIWAYPEEYLIEFRRWMRNEYKDHFVNNYSPSRLLKPVKQIG